MLLGDLAVGRWTADDVDFMVRKQSCDCRHQNLRFAAAFAAPHDTTWHNTLLVLAFPSGKYWRCLHNSLNQWIPLRLDSSLRMKLKQHLPVTRQSIPYQFMHSFVEFPFPCTCAPNVEEIEDDKSTFSTISILVFSRNANFSCPWRTMIDILYSMISNSGRQPRTMCTLWSRKRGGPQDTINQNSRNALRNTSFLWMLAWGLA